MAVYEIELIHQNERYSVYYNPNSLGEENAYDPEGNKVDGNYEVHHNNYGCIEYKTINLPTALSVAEHYNTILVGQLYLADPEDSAKANQNNLIKLFSGEDGDDGGGTIQ